MATQTVSVLIPTYNRASFLPRTLTSVFDQTRQPDEVILVDDGSTDDTPDVVRSLVSRNPSWAGRLRYIHQRNQGKSVAVNAALSLAQGDWIAFNDSDDRWLPDKLEWQFRAVARFSECDACFTETSLGLFRERHREFTNTHYERVGKVGDPCWLFARNWPGISVTSMLVRAATMRRCGEFDPRFLVAEDVDFMFRLSLLTPFCYVDLPLVEIDQDPNRTLGLSTSYPARSWTAMLIAESRLEKWLSLLDDSKPGLRGAIAHELASARSALANRFFLTGDLESASRELARCRSDCPELRLLVKWLLLKLAPNVLRRVLNSRAPAEFLAATPHDRSTIQEMRLRLGQ